LECLRIKAPAHLHAGNMDLHGGFGRLFGTVGFTIDYPFIVVEVEKSRDIQADDPYAKRFAESLVKSFETGGVVVRVRERFYENAGLGYITTLGLSIGLGISELYNLRKSLEEIALTIKRGLVTALGLYACRYGGFIVEGGFRKELRDRSIPPLIFRGDIPDDWFFVVAVPERPWRKLNKLRVSSEPKILEEVRASDEEASYLSRLVLMKIIPSFIEKDLKSFGEGLTEFNRRLGYIWMKYQGGVYCDPLVERGIEIMTRYTYAACQSSWGPTFYGITDSEESAKRAVEELEQLLRGNGGGVVFVTHGRNRGLEVESCG